MTTSSVLAWLVEASVVLGLVVLLILAVRRALHGRIGASWIYGLWLAAPAALLASLTPAGLITLPADLFPAPLLALFDPGVGPTAAPAADAISRVDPAPPASGAAALPTLVLLVWAIGFALFTFIQLDAQLRLHRSIVARARRPTDRERAALEVAAAETPLSAARDFRFTNRVASPAACGLSRPVVLLPEDFLARYAPEERRVMVLHEAEHLRARHLRHRLIAQLIRGAFWFHPLAWLGERAFVADQELACDQAALGRDPSIRPRTYAETLLKIARQIAESGAPRPVASASLIGAEELKERTSMLERHASLGRTRAAGLLTSTAVATVSLIAGLAACVAASAQDPGDSPQARAAEMEALSRRMDELRRSLAEIEYDVIERRTVVEHALHEEEVGQLSTDALERERQALRRAELEMAERRDALAQAVRALEEQALEEQLARGGVALTEREGVRRQIENAEAQRLVQELELQRMQVEVDEERMNVRQAAGALQAQRVELERVRRDYELGAADEAAVEEARRALENAEVAVNERRVELEARVSPRPVRVDLDTAESQVRGEIREVEAHLARLHDELRRIEIDRAAAQNAEN